MSVALPRRSFLKTAATAGALAGLGELDFLPGLPRVSAAEAKLDPRAVQFSPEIAPLVRLLEDTPRERLLEEVGTRIQRGTAYRDVLAALLLAGVRNIQPRPVGFKFHAVLVVNSAHLASQNSPAGDRWLPIFWALDQFKASQARDQREGDWTLGAVDEANVPKPERARAAFVAAMDNWDQAAADTATAGLTRACSPAEVFELFCRYGARDFRDLGHKAIFVANSWRTLQTIGWQHAEPVLRSLTYALLDHEAGNPAQRDAQADRTGRLSAERIKRLPADWEEGKPEADATRIFLRAVRTGTWQEAGELAGDMLMRGVAPRSIWDGIFQGAGELLMRRPGIGTLHAVTTCNALHHGFQHAREPATRALLLMQAATFLPLFRGRPGGERDVAIDDFEPLAPAASGREAMAEIFADVTRDKLLAARKTLGWLSASRDARPFVDAAQRLIFLKGTDSHDYKLSSAMLEDYHHLSPPLRERFLAASVFWLKGSGAPDNALVARARAAL